MRDAHSLVMNYRSAGAHGGVSSNGVKTTSTTTDPAMVATLRQHPRDMDAHLKNGGHVRRWDPLFSELAEHHDQITMAFRGCGERH